MSCVFRYARRALPGFALLLALTAHAVESAATAYEPYSSRPDILSLTPRAYVSFGGSEDVRLRHAQLETVAMLLEMYPDRELYFLARDAEPLHDLARALTKDLPTVQRRIHLLNVSSDTRRDQHLGAYLRQEGISEGALRAGRKVLFVDTGFQGSIPREIAALFPKELRHRLQTHLLDSGKPDLHPSTRVFFQTLKPGVGGLDTVSLTQAYEQMPRYMDRATHYEFVNGRWEPMSPVGRQSDGEVSRSKALARMQDLLAFANQPGTTQALDGMRARWKALLALQGRGWSPARIAEELRTMLRAHPGDPVFEAVIHDFLEIKRLNSADKSSWPTMDEVADRLPTLHCLGKAYQTIKK